MKYILLLSLSLALFAKLSFAGIISYDYIEVIPSLGPLQMFQSSDWIQADTSVSETNSGSVSIDEFDKNSSFFECIDYNTHLLSLGMSWISDRYFVNVYPEESVTFKVLYYDNYGNMPSTGYPVVDYWVTRSSITSLTLDYAGESENGWLYRKTIALSPGIYSYQYKVKNDVCPGEFCLETSSFAICQPPSNPANLGIADNAVVSTARICLRWSSIDPQGSSISYRLFTGKDSSNLLKVYEGIDTTYELTSLDPGSKYYWQVECLNAFGISRKSPLYSFTTIRSIEKPFNYPNPFNPRKQKTNIVYKTGSAQTARIKIFSEFGDLIYETEQSALDGINEYSYDGRDMQGQTLFNGSYVCRIETSEGNKTCYLLVIQ